MMRTILVGLLTLFAAFFGPEASSETYTLERTSEGEVGVLVDPDILTAEKQLHQMGCPYVEMHRLLGVRCGTTGPWTQPPSVIRRVQNWLKEQDHDPGPIDGIFGKRTANAIREFQKKNGMKETGDISQELVEALCECQIKISFSQISPVQLFHLLR